MVKLSPKQILRTTLIFIISYVIFLILWIQLKDYYGYGMTMTASRAVAYMKDVEIEAIHRNSERIQVTFVPHRINKDILIDVPVKTNTYTFNAPLTFSIMAALFPFIRKRPRAYTEALLLLLAVHLLFIVTFELKEITDIMTHMKLVSPNQTKIFFYQFLWGFTDNMVIRFEPFLIGFYVFARFRK